MAYPLQQCTKILPLFSCHNLFSIIFILNTIYNVKKSFYYFNFFLFFFKFGTHFATTPSDYEKTFQEIRYEKKEKKNITRCKVGTLIATTTSSARKAVQPSLDQAVGVTRNNDKPINNEHYYDHAKVMLQGLQRF